MMCSMNINELEADESKRDQDSFHNINRCMAFDLYPQIIIIVLIIIDMHIATVSRGPVGLAI